MGSPAQAPHPDGTHKTTLKSNENPGKVLNGLTLLTIVDKDAKNARGKFLIISVQLENA